jgi:hypothetical protein
MNPQIQEITIEGKVYIPKESAKCAVPSGPIRIVVLQRGWVAIGKFSRNASGEVNYSPLQLSKHGELQKDSLNS